MLFVSVYLLAVADNYCCRSLGAGCVLEFTFSNSCFRAAGDRLEEDLTVVIAALGLDCFMTLRKLYNEYVFTKKKCLVVVTRLINRVYYAIHFASVGKIIILSLCCDTVLHIYIYVIRG